MANEINNPLLSEQPTGEPIIESTNETNETPAESNPSSNPSIFGLIDEYSKLFQKSSEQQKQNPSNNIERQQEKQLSKEEIEELSEKIKERFYDNPYELFEEIKLQAYQSAKEEIEQSRREVEALKLEREYEKEINEVSRRYPDFHEYQEHMTKLLEINPQIANLPNKLDTLYFLAKGMSQPKVRAEDVLNDKEILNAIKSNEKLRNDIIQQYLNEKNPSNVAKVMGQQPRGAFATQPQSKPKSIKEGGALFREYMRQQGLL